MSKAGNSLSHKRPRAGAISCLCLVLLAGESLAGPIIGATSAVVHIGGTGLPGTYIESTYNQQGLSNFYESGVSDFDAYIATTPLHAYTYSGTEWFSDYDTSKISVTYDLGTLAEIDGIAFWNEDQAGVGKLDFYGSADNIEFFDLALGLTPTINPVNRDYSADVYNFGVASARYVRLEGSQCVGAPTFGYTGCSLAEIAFRATDVSGPPQPDFPDANSFLNEAYDFVTSYKDLFDAATVEKMV